VCATEHEDPRTEGAAKTMAEYLHGEPWADMPEGTRAAFREHVAVVLTAAYRDKVKGTEQGAGA